MLHKIESIISENLIKPITNKKRSVYARLKKIESIKHEVKKVEISEEEIKGNLGENLELKANYFQNGVIRIIIKEENSREFRNNIDKEVLVDSTQKIPKENVKIKEVMEGEVLNSSNGDSNLSILSTKEKGFEMIFKNKGSEYLRFNSNSKLALEDSKESKKFAHGTRCDITFTKSSHFYGLPERCSSLKLKETKKDNPYRLFNVDPGAYLKNDQAGLYGSVPFILAIREDGKASGFFFLNASDLYIDVFKKNSFEIISNCGLLNFFFIPGPSVSKVIENFTSLVGKPIFPPLYSLGYHQCRWSYKNQEDVLQVIQKFKEEKIPMDTIWLDIDYTDKKKYFTWDKKSYNPKEFVEELEKQKKHLAIITDPHIKCDNEYPVYKEALEKGLFVKNNKGVPFKGLCWPGKSSWLDFYNPETRKFWGDLYKDETLPDEIFIWIDMNEPAVFKPGSTMNVNCVQSDGEKAITHGEIHNMYGFLHAMATYNGLLKRNKENNLRPTVLTRSFFPGSQRYSQVWTGDNYGTWDQLQISIPMCFSLGISGISLVGADCGGFMESNFDTEMFYRWFQLGIFYPFFRGHSAKGSIRKEPYLFGKEITERIKNAIKKRYLLLPYLYKEIWKSSNSGIPVMKPVFVEFDILTKEDEFFYDSEDHFMFGSSILVHPILEKQMKKTKVHFPSSISWYDFFSGEFIEKKEIEINNLQKNKDLIPMFQRAGSVVCLYNMEEFEEKECLSTTDIMEKKISMNIQLALDPKRNYQAEGDFFFDDGKSFNYKTKKESIQTNFKFENNTFVSKTSLSNYKKGKDVLFHKLTILGYPTQPKTIKLYTKDKETKVLDQFTYKENKIELIINTSIALDFSIEFE